MASVTFTSAANGGFQGADTGIVASFGASIVGNLLFGAATKWRLVTTNPLTGSNTVVFELNDPTLAQNSLVSVLLSDTPFSGSDAVFLNSGGVVSWTWTGITDASTLVAGFNTSASITFAAVPRIALATPVGEGSLIDLAWTTNNAGVGTFTSLIVVRDGITIADGLDPSTTSYTDATVIIGSSHTYAIHGHFSSFLYDPVVSNLQTVCTDVFNCDCESVSTYDTLLNVRTKIMNRLYPNQSANPPPGIATLIDQHLRDAQAEIYRQLQRAALRTERFFRWTMVQGQRYYGLTANDNCCVEKLDPTKITWVGFEDLNSAWYRLDEGIPPEYYTRANINFGWPTRFEIRSCIEIFPAPQAPYTLWIKGDFGLGPLVADTDRFTIDDMAVYLLALGNLKADRGAKDAQLVLTQAGNYTKGLVAGSHGTRRYVPRAQTENPLTPPRFLPLGADQA